MSQRLKLGAKSEIENMCVAFWCLTMERKEDMDAVFGMLDVRGWAGAADVDADADAENDGYLDKSAGSGGSAFDIGLAPSAATLNARADAGGGGIMDASNLSSLFPCCSAGILDLCIVRGTAL
jgi:hypothetical protein